MIYGFGTMYSQSDSNDVYWDNSLCDSTCSRFHGVSSIAQSNDSTVYLAGNLIYNCDDSYIRTFAKFKKSINNFRDVDINHPIPNKDSGQYISSIVIKGNSIYVAGYFNRIGGINANGIAKFDGTNWFSLGQGIKGLVNKIMFKSSDLYAVGLFDSAGNVKTSCVAKWDGKTWSGFGKGVTSHVGKYNREYVNSISIIGSKVFIGGEFDTVGGVYANNIAMWNGTVWSGMNLGVRLEKQDQNRDGLVNTLESIGGVLYVGGEFDTVGNNIATNNIAKYDTIKGWSSLGSGTISIGALNNTSTVECMKVVGTKLFVGGTFTSICGTEANNIAMFNGTTWSCLGSGTSGVVSVIDVGKTGLYIGGGFDSVGHKYCFGSFARYTKEIDTTNNGTIKSDNLNNNLNIGINLKENIPQPFKEETKFNVILKEPKEVTISVLNDKGQLIKIIYKGLIEGEKEFIWSGKGESNGIYYYRITGNGINETKKFVLVK